ncbi:MAG: tetraacyldisaccharide 4'-kinase [Burkholderiales bacterium]|nr:tetraacyldisaccharide 4'-kinase [Burkholderiales bacterium]
MEAWLTREWQRTSPWQILLRPVSWLYRLLIAIRRLAFRTGFLKSHAIGVPVIIVGNVTVGGTGKTPLVLALVEALTKRDLHCGIVTRGYLRGAEAIAANVIHVVPANGQHPVSGDEATLLARRSGVPVYAGADRVEVARTLRRSHPEVDVIIGDDGLQHYALRRDIEICVVDSARGMGNGELLPAGPMREPAARINAVSAVVFNGKGGHAAHNIAAIPTFEMVLANELFINLKTDQCIDARTALDVFHGRRLHALAGTGHPQRFFSHLAGLGFAPSVTQPFPDHHRYRAIDMPGPGADIILMTEKDAVKCGSFADERMWFMRIDAVLPDGLIDFVINKLRACV